MCLYREGVREVAGNVSKFTALTLLLTFLNLARMRSCTADTGQSHYPRTSSYWCNFSGVPMVTKALISNRKPRSRVSNPHFKHHLPRVATYSSCDRKRGLSASGGSFLSVSMSLLWTMGVRNPHERCISAVLQANVSALYAQGIPRLEGVKGLTSYHQVIPLE